VAEGTHAGGTTVTPEASRRRRRIGRALISGRLPIDYTPEYGRCSVCRINNPRGCHPKCPCHCHRPGRANTELTMPTDTDYGTEACDDRARWLAEAQAEMPDTLPPTAEEIEAMWRLRAAELGLTGDDAELPF
jgi:hypothetical protein